MVRRLSLYKTEGDTEGDTVVNKDGRTVVGTLRELWENPLSILHLPRMEALRREITKLGKLEDSHPGSMETEDSHPGSMETEDSHPGSMETEDSHPGSMETEDSHLGSMETEDSHLGSMETEKGTYVVHGEAARPF